MRLWILAATTLGLVACQEVVTVDPAGRATVLIAVPVSWADSVFVALGRSEPGRAGRAEPGAELEIAVDGPTIRLQEAPPGTCGGALRAFTCYRGELGGALEPGDAVRLEGRLASGRSIRGEAVAPPVPDIDVEGAQAGDTVRGIVLSEPAPFPEVLGVRDEEGRVTAADTVVLATVWAAGDVRECPVQLPGPPPDFDLRTASRVGLSVEEPACPEMPDLRWDSMAVPVTFLRYDANFTAWSQLPHHAQEAGPGLEGINGVFGAATPRVFVLIVTP